MPHVTTHYENNKKRLKMHKDQTLRKNRKKKMTDDSKIPNEDLMAEEQAEMKAQAQKAEHSHSKKTSSEKAPKHASRHEKTEADSAEMDQSHSAYEASGVEREEEASLDEDEGVQASSEDMENPKVHLEFYGSEYIRMKAPEVMNFAESVVGEWQQDGDFEGLPVDNPMAQMVAAKALRKAKDIEKTLDEKGVFTIARMGVDYVKSKIEKR